MYIVNNYPMAKNKPFYHARISKLMKRSKIQQYSYLYQFSSRMKIIIINFDAEIFLLADQIKHCLISSVIIKRCVINFLLRNSEKFGHPKKC